VAHDSYEHWRESDHDDLVLAVACAAWFREYTNREIEPRNHKQGGYRASLKREPSAALGGPSSETHRATCPSLL
jgi:hypothetical protein